VSTTEEPRAPTAWHADAPASVLSRLRTTEGGLSSHEAAARLARHGPNRLPRIARPSALELLLGELRNPLMYALLLSAVVAVALGELEDGLVVLAVVVLNALIGFGQEYRARSGVSSRALLRLRGGRYLLACRSLTRPNRELGWWSNPAVYAGIAVVVALQALFVFAPLMHDIFGSARIEPRALGLAAAGALAILPVAWAEERWRTRRSTPA
jgi:magnesium-transporting ATPase (P-type)